MNIYSEELSTIKDQSEYEKSFIKKFGSKIDSDKPFYFNDSDIVDGTTGEVIKEAKLERDSWNHITKVLFTYFHLNL